MKRLQHATLVGGSHRAYFPILLLAAISSLSPNLVIARAAAQSAADKVIHGVSYVGVTVSDLAASAEMYAQSADLKEVGRGPFASRQLLADLTGRDDVSAESRLLESSNAQVRLIQLKYAEGADSSSPNRPGAVPVNGPGIAHVCYQSDGTRETYQRFLARGAQPLGNREMVTLSPRNPVVYAYSLDRDGIMFEVEHIDIDKVTTAKLEKGFYRIRHVSLASPDIERAISFYSHLLETSEPRRLGGADGLSGDQFDQVSGLPGTRLLMAWFQVRNLELELVQYLSHPTEKPVEPRPLNAPGYSMIVFDVGSLEAAKDRLIQAGGTIATEPRTMDGGEIFFGRDPDLNLLGFLVSPEGSVVSSDRFPTQ